MREVEQFEDLIAWQKARVLTKAIYQVTQQGKFAKDYGLAGQIQRATVSIMSNIAEGFERGNRNEFHQFLVIAKSSCAEVRSQLYIALDVGYLDQVQFDQLMNQAQEVTRILGGLRASVDRQRKNQDNRRD
jgi:four helix bundle protein